MMEYGMMYRITCFPNYCPIKSSMTGVRHLRQVQKRLQHQPQHQLQQLQQLLRQQDCQENFQFFIFMKKMVLVLQRHFGTLLKNSRKPILM